MTFVHREVSSVTSHFHKRFEVFVAINVDKVHSAVENRNAFLVAIHVFLVGRGLGINLFCDVVHKVTHDLVKLTFVGDN